LKCEDQRGVEGVNLGRDGSNMWWTQRGEGTIHNSGEDPVLCSGLSHGSIHGELSRGAELKFGTFSLGDVFEQEIRRLSEFAFRGKHTKGEASKRFVEDFVRNQQDM
jgi:hypothetical protein